MKSLIFKIAFFFFFALVLSCEKSELEEDLGNPGKEDKTEDKQEVNHKTVFPESIIFLENSTKKILLKVSDDNGIEKITTTSTAFEVTSQDNSWYISPKEAFDYETYSATSVSINVTDKLENQETRSIAIIITDEDESVPPDSTENGSVTLQLPIIIEFYSADGSLYYTIYYEYDQQDRQVRYDYITPSNPEADLYMVTNYSGNTATAKTYSSQTNKLTYYTVTTSSASDKPITIEYYSADGSLYYTISYEYDQQDRQVRYDYITPSNPEADLYMVTNYSGNTATAKTYSSQTNKLTYYTATTSSASDKPITIEYYSADGSLYYTISYEYDQQDRQVRYDYVTPSNPEADLYMVTNYSGNTATAKTYSSETNKLTYYTVTTYKE